MNIIFVSVCFSVQGSSVHSWMQCWVELCSYAQDWTARWCRRLPPPTVQHCQSHVHSAADGSAAECTTACCTKVAAVSHRSFSLWENVCLSCSAVHGSSTWDVCEVGPSASWSTDNSVVWQSSEWLVRRNECQEKCRRCAQHTDSC